MMIDDMLPDLGLSYLEAGHDNATFTFGRLTCSMMARIEQDLYTTMATVTMDRAYAASIDFDGARFAALLAVVTPAARSELRRIFADPFRGPTQTDLPRGAVAMGVRARLGKRQSNGDETYVPFVATEFMAPAVLASISLTE